MGTDSNSTLVEGEYTSAEIFLPREEIEDEAYEQVQSIVDHPAFRNPVRVMPDMHWGKGCVIGFTMPLDKRVCPNTVGVDIGCGMLATKITDHGVDLDSSDELEEIDERIRVNIPMGRNVHSRSDYHMRDDFPWDEVQEKWESFAEQNLNGVDLGEYDPETFEYGIEYFKSHCRKIGYDMTRGINSLGTLGGGNHFIELATGSEGDLWCVIHSGSRGIGATTADYHQERAQEIRSVSRSRDTLRQQPDEYLDYVKFDIDTVSDKDLLSWLQGGMGESFVDYDALKSEYSETNPEKIEEIGSSLKTAIPSENGDSVSELAYLEGEESVEYFVDVAFAQTYASVSRKEMAKRVADVLGGSITDQVESVHNYVDYQDGIIRKGATPARDGQRAVVPMNMSEGSYLVRGKGNENWNQSSPHGAGRQMSRRAAFDTLSKDDMTELMGDTVATELPLDESPQAYKESALVRKAMEPTVDVVDHLSPVLNLKAPE